MAEMETKNSARTQTPPRRPSSPRRGPRRRWRFLPSPRAAAVTLLALLALAAAGLLFLKPVEEEARRRMTALRDSLLDEAGTRLGLDIACRSLGPSLFGTLDIRGLRVSVRGGGADGGLLFTAARLRVSWGAPAPAAGGGGTGGAAAALRAVKAVRLDRPVLSEGALRRLAERFAPAGGGADGASAAGVREAAARAAALLPDGFLFRVRRGSFAGSGASAGGAPGGARGVSFEARRVNLDITLSGGGAAFFVQGAAGAGVNAGGGSAPRLPSVRLSFKARGEAQAGFRDGSALAVITGLGGAGFTVKPFRISLGAENGALSAALLTDAPGLSLTASRAPGSPRAALSLALDTFLPRSLVSFSGPLRKRAPWLGLSFSGAASLTAPLALPVRPASLTFTAGLSALFPRRFAPADGLPLTLAGASLTLTAEGSGRRAVIRELAFDSASGSAVFRGGASLAPFEPRGSLAVSGLLLKGPRAGAEQTLSGVCSLAFEGGELRLTEGDFSAGPARLSQMDAALAPRSGGFAFKVRAFTSQGGESGEQGEGNGERGMGNGERGEGKGKGEGGRGEDHIGGGSFPLAPKLRSACLSATPSPRGASPPKTPALGRYAETSFRTLSPTTLNSGGATLRVPHAPVPPPPLPAAVSGGSVPLRNLSGRRGTLSGTLGTLPELLGTLSGTLGTLPEERGTLPETLGTLPEERGTLSGQRGTLSPRRGTLSPRLTAFSAPLTAFREPLTAFSEPPAAFSEPLAAFREPLTAFREPLTAFSEPLTAFREPPAAFRERLPAFSERLPWFGAAFGAGGETAEAEAEPAPETAGGFFEVEGSYSFSPRRLEARGFLSALPVRGILDAAGWLLPVPSPSARSFLHTLALSGGFSLDTDFTSVSYDAPWFTASWLPLPGLSLSASFSGRDAVAGISDGRFSWPGGEAALSGYVDGSRPERLALYLGSSWGGVPYYVDAALVDGRLLSVTGSYGVRGFVIAGEGGGFSAYLQTEEMPFPFQGGRAYLTAAASLDFASPDEWKAELENCEVDGLTTYFGKPSRLRFTGAGNQSGFAIRGVRFDDGRGALTGDGRLTWDKGYQRPRVSVALVSGGVERLRLEGEYGEEGLRAALSGESVQLARFSPLFFPGTTASGSLRYSSGGKGAFRADLDLTAFSSLFRTFPVTARGRAAITEKTLAVTGLIAECEGVRAGVSSFVFDKGTGTAALSAWAGGDFHGRGLYLLLSGESAFSPALRWRDWKDCLAEFSGSVVVEQAWYGAAQADGPFAVAFSRKDTEGGRLVSVDGGPENMFRLRHFEGGDFYAALSRPSPVRGDAMGLLSKTAVDLQTSNLYVDLGALWRVLPPQDIVNFPGGFVTGSLSAAGSPGDPDITGALTGSGVRIEVPRYLSAEILPVRFVCPVEDGVITLGPVDCAVGNGAGVVTGSFHFDRWIPRIFTLDIAVPEASPIPASVLIAGVKAEGLVAGNLRLANDEDGPFSAAGSLTLSDTIVSLTQDDASPRGAQAAPPPPSASAADITLTADRKVEFLWPAANFPILQAYADMGSSLRVTSDNQTGQFTLRGDIGLRGGEIFYFERSFYIREGTLSFNENETRFDPRISARAEIRDRSEEGDVVISMIVDNAPLSSFTARLESSPALSQAEIFSILGQNFASPEAAGSGGSGLLSGGSRVLGASTDVLMQFQGVRRVQRALRNFLKLDMLSMRTSIPQNAVFLATGTDSQGEGGSAAAYLLNNTAVSVGKYLGANIFVQAMASLRYSQSAMGTAAVGTDSGRGIDIGQGFSVEPDIGVEMQNPLFGIGISVTPEPEHLNAFFLNDANLTLTWRRTF
ncbi:MAG: translocation/assembly module TamB domain-containing protein [Treponematales bacterium]